MLHGTYGPPGSTSRRQRTSVVFSFAPAHRTHALRALLTAATAAALLMLPAPSASAAGSSSDPGALVDVGSTSGSVTPSGLDRADNPDWMGRLPDSARLSDLSLPGTHDTMARNASVFALTQDAELSTQLRAGIRVLDIRARHFRDAFPIHHDLEYLNANFTDVVVSVTDFLRDHPTEAVVMRLKQEYTPAENTRSFEDTLNWYLHTNPDTADRLQQALWRPTGTTLPTLGAVRGKIVLLQDFTASTAFGLRWAGPAMDVQDTYQLTGLGDLDRKWGLVRAQFERSAAGTGTVLYVNHLSATGAPAAMVTGTLPVTVARGGGATGSGGTSGMLERTVQYLTAHPTGRTGAVMADFPTADLVDELVARNFR